MTQDRVRIVLDDSEEEGNVTAVAGKHHWVHTRSIAQSGDQPEEYIYTTRDGATLIHWIQDHKTGVKYILVNGPEAPKVSKILRDKLLHFAPEYIGEHARERGLGATERRLALYHLALDKMEHGFDQATFDLYKQAMGDPDPIVRGGAVLGSAYLGWPQLAEPMRALATAKEPDESIRKDAGLLLPRLEKQASS